VGWRACRETDDPQPPVLGAQPGAERSLAHLFQPRARPSCWAPCYLLARLPCRSFRRCWNASECACRFNIQAECRPCRPQPTVASDPDKEEGGLQGPPAWHSTHFSGVARRIRAAPSLLTSAGTQPPSYSRLAPTLFGGVAQVNAGAVWAPYRAICGRGPVCAVASRWSGIRPRAPPPPESPSRKSMGVYRFRKRAGLAGSVYISIVLLSLKWTVQSSDPPGPNSVSFKYSDPRASGATL